MNKKKKIVIITVAVVIALVTILTVVIIKSKKFNSDVKENENYIKENYEVFNNKTSNFNEKRLSFGTFINEKFYYENLNKEEANILVILNEYQDAMDNLNANSTELLKKCTYKINDANVKEKCTLIKKSINSAKEIFKKDIANYNLEINKYNEWTTKNTKYQKIDAFDISIEL